MISVTVQPSAFLLRNLAILSFAYGKRAGFFVTSAHSYGLCSKCKVLS